MISGQSYKLPMSVNYYACDILTGKLPKERSIDVFMFLEHL